MGLQTSMGLKNEVLLGICQGTHSELGEHFENLMGTDWELDKDIFGVNLKTKEFCPMQEGETLYAF